MGGKEMKNGVGGGGNMTLRCGRGRLELTTGCDGGDDGMEGEGRNFRGTKSLGRSIFGYVHGSFLHLET